MTPRDWPLICQAVRWWFEDQWDAFRNFVSAVSKGIKELVWR